VGQTVAEMVRYAGRENLRLGLQAAESAGMYDAVTIPLKDVAGGVGRFGIAPAATLSGWKAERGEIL